MQLQAFAADILPLYPDFRLCLPAPCVISHMSGDEASFAVDSELGNVTWTMSQLDRCESMLLAIHWSMASPFINPYRDISATIDEGHVVEAYPPCEPAKLSDTSVLHPQVTP